MRITSLNIVKRKNRKSVFYNIETDEERNRTVQADTVVYFNLHTGDELTEEQWSSLGIFDDEKTIIQISLDLISRRLRSEKELHDRFIRMGMHDIAVDNAITHLRNNGYLNDDEFALRFAKQLIKTKPVGEIKLRYELKKKGIPDTTTERVISGLMDTQMELALQAANKKMKTLKISDPDVMKQKLWRFLEQRGFTGDVIRKTVNALKIV